MENFNSIFFYFYDTTTNLAQVLIVSSLIDLSINIYKYYCIFQAFESPHVRSAAVTLRIGCSLPLLLSSEWFFLLTERCYALPFCCFYNTVLYVLLCVCKKSLHSNESRPHTSRKTLCGAETNCCSSIIRSWVAI